MLSAVKVTKENPMFQLGVRQEKQKKKAYNGGHIHFMYWQIDHRHT